MFKAVVKSKFLKKSLDSVLEGRKGRPEERGEMEWKEGKPEGKSEGKERGKGGKVKWRRESSVDEVVRVQMADFVSGAIDVREICKEVKESLNDLLLDYDEYSFYANSIMDYCKALEGSAGGISYQLDDRDDTMLEYGKIQGDNPTIVPAPPVETSS